MAEPDTKAMLDIGKYCPTCRTVDFLPRRCEFCKLVFCASHASPPSLHDCSGLVDSVVVEGRFDQKFQDLLPGSREGLIAAERAEAELVKDQRREAAQAILRKNFGDAAVGRGGPKEVKAAVVKARSAVVELAILKGKAKQGDPRKGLGEVKMEDRIYFKAVFYEFKSGERAEAGMKELWMPKTTSAGKALDLLAEHFGQTNINNRNPEASKILSIAEPTSASSEFELIAPSVTLGSAIINGGTLWLIRGSPSPSL